MKRALVFSALFAILLTPSVLFAQMPMRGDISVFAYPGTTCPGGSERMDVPEQVDAEKSGAIYCRYTRKVIVVSKEISKGTCPSGMTPYTDTKAKPNPDHIWCQLPGPPAPPVPVSGGPQKPN